MTRHRNAAFAVVLVIVSLLALQHSPLSHSGTAAPSSSSLTFHLAGNISGWNFTGPTVNPTITVTQGDMVSIILTSDDIDHQFALDLDRDGTKFIGMCPTGDTCSNVLRTGIGDTVSFTASSPGTYVYFCTFHNNMVGSFIVRPSPSILAAVRGSDGNVYWSTFNIAWSNWLFLNGNTLSSPALCSSGPGSVEVVVRGSDNAIYHKSFSNGVWASSWDGPGGGTSDQPACAVLNGVLYVVVRGNDDSLYVSSRTVPSGSWSPWVGLAGWTGSAPTLVASADAARLDLVVRGADQQIYHKAFVSGAWSPSWDSLGGSTSDVPATTSVGGLLHVLVRGTDNSIYYNSLSFSTSTLSGWISLSGWTPSPPALQVDASGTIHLVVRGANNGIYHKEKTTSGSWSVNWDSPGGSTLSTPGTSVLGTNLYLVVRGGDQVIYNNSLNTSTSVWSTWTSLGGTTMTAPSVVGS